MSTLIIHFGDRATPLPCSRETCHEVEQVHGTSIHLIPSALTKPEADALVTSKNNTPLLIKTADCMPIVLFDGTTLALVHAGWRGVTAGIIENALANMDTKNVEAYIGPSLGTCCAEFSDPRNEIPQQFHHHIHANYVDLWGVADEILSSVKSVINNKICTKCNAERYFSHRHDPKNQGRNYTIAWMSA